MLTSPLFSRRPGAWPALVAAGLLVGQLTAADKPLAHELYFGARLSKSFMIGGKSEKASGFFRSADRVNIDRVGFANPKQDGIAADPRDPNVLFTASLNGVQRSLDGGRTWRIMTSWNMTEPKSIAIDPNAPDHVYIGLPDGVGVSRDRGMTWTRMNEGIKRRYTQMVLVDRTKAGRVFAGTEQGLFVSDDAAKSWRLAFATQETVTDIKQSPQEPRVFLAVTQRNGAFHSSDGGATWQRIAGLSAEHTLYNCDFDAANARRWIVCGWDIGVLLSEDGGATWTPRNAGLPNTQIWRVSFDPDVPGRLYVAPHIEPIFISDDSGLTWRRGWLDGACVWNFTFLPRRNPAAATP